MQGKPCILAFFGTETSRASLLFEDKKAFNVSSKQIIFVWTISLEQLVLYLPVELFLGQFYIFCYIFLDL
jgi:hypothetical protein